MYFVHPYVAVALAVAVAVAVATFSRVPTILDACSGPVHTYTVLLLRFYDRFAGNRLGTNRRTVGYEKGLRHRWTKARTHERWRKAQTRLFAPLQ